MKNEPFFRVVCEKCNFLQNYRGQDKCIHCDTPLNKKYVTEVVQRQIERRQVVAWEKQMSEVDHDDGA